MNYPHTLLFQGDITRLAPDLSSHAFGDGRLIMPEGNELLAGDDMSAQLETFIEAYEAERLRSPFEIPDLDEQEYLGSGAQGNVYELSPGSDQAVKVTEHDPLHLSRTLAHMEAIRACLGSVVGAQYQVKVPKHYGVYVPEHEEYDALVLERVQGVDVFHVLNGDEQDLPSLYRHYRTEIFMSFAGLETFIRGRLHDAGLRFGDVMEDWANPNVLVEAHETTSSHPPLTYWVIDQVSPQ